jgi:pilus assembly protein Flp/PilA
MKHIKQMFNFRNRIGEVLRRSEDRGATAVEYSLIVGLIAVVIILAVTFLGAGIAQTYDQIRCELSGQNWTDYTGTSPYDTATNYDAQCNP